MKFTHLSRITNWNLTTIFMQTSENCKNGQNWTEIWVSWFCKIHRLTKYMNILVTEKQGVCFCYHDKQNKMDWQVTSCHWNIYYLNLILYRNTSFFFLVLIKVTTSVTKFINTIILFYSTFPWGKSHTTLLTHELRKSTGLMQTVFWEPMLTVGV